MSLPDEEEAVEESKCTLPSEEQTSSSAREGAANTPGRYIYAYEYAYIIIYICIQIYIYIYICI